MKKPETDKCILLFTKFPEKGKIKTRLSEDLDPLFVRTIYHNFVLDLMETLNKGGWPTIINYFPPESGKAVSKWLGENHRYLPQKGADLGERMKNAFRETFTLGFSKAVVIGSDMPDLELSVLSEAFDALATKDAVIGPALDGGYYLMGFRQECFVPGVFDGISWGGDSVLRNTLKILGKKDCSVHMLPELRDVDNVEDLRALYYRNRNRPFAKSRTMRYISEVLGKGTALWSVRAGD